MVEEKRTGRLRRQLIDRRVIPDRRTVKLAEEAYKAMMGATEEENERRTGKDRRTSPKRRYGLAERRQMP